MKNWGKLMLSKLKKYVFGTDKLNKNDIARLLGSEVYKGFDTRGVRMMGKTPKFSFKDEASAKKQTRHDFNRVMDSLGLKGNTEAKKALREYIASETSHPESFIKAMFGKGDTYEGFMEDVGKFHASMSGINIPKLSIVADKARWFSHYKNIERLRVIKGVDITRDLLSADMKKLGVKSGNIWDATADQLETYLSLLKNIEYPDKLKNDYLYKYEMNNAIGEQNPAWTQLKGRVLPLSCVQAGFCSPIALFISYLYR